jgi:hypothetical protein
MSVFWVFAHCSDDGGSKHLRNVGELPDCTAQQPRIQPSSGPVQCVEERRLATYWRKSSRNLSHVCKQGTFPEMILGH